MIDLWKLLAIAMWGTKANTAALYVSVIEAECGRGPH